jgi:mycothiol system anti-sigma-R factor
MAEMIDCGDALLQLSAFLDGELTDEKRAAIDDHLQRCAPCDGARHFEGELRVVIQDRCREEVPDDLRQRILAAIANEAK